MSKKIYKIVDLFAGCGGLSCGLEQAGFTPWFVNEIIETFCNTYKRNHNLIAICTGYNDSVLDAEKTDIRPSMRALASMSIVMSMMKHEETKK